MTTTASSPILQFLRKVFVDPSTRNCPDRELLQRFLREKDPAAFESLLRRHGPMVFDVCQSVLANQADAEDAFQATFLILARKGASIRKAASLASWLYGVAYRSAQKMQAASARRRKHEAGSPPRTVAEVDDLSWREVRQQLHEELNALPRRLQSPIVLCYLEGMTQDQAAAELGLPKGTLKGRLERGRKLLRQRLVRRGIGPSAVLAASTWPAAPVSAELPSTLVEPTTEAAIAVTGGHLTAGIVSDRVAHCMTGDSKTMFITKMKTATAVLAVAAIIGLSAYTFSVHSSPRPVNEKAPVPVQSAGKQAKPAGQVKVPKDKTWVKSSDGVLALHLSAEQTAVTTGKPIKLIATLRNLSKKSVKVIRPFAHEIMTSTMYVGIDGPNGKVKYSGLFPDIILDVSAFAQIPPGKSIQSSFLLKPSKFKGLKVPGKYTIDFKYEYIGRWNFVLSLKGLPTDVWKGKIKSKSITVTVYQPHNPPRPDNPLSNAVINGGQDPKDPRIQALVAYMGKNGVEMVHSGDSGYWYVVKPKPTDGKFVVSIRSFPASATELQMRYAISNINLAYKLNASAHIAMSYVNGQGTKKTIRAEFDAAEKKVNDLFQRYTPAAENKKSAPGTADVKNPKAASKEAVVILQYICPGDARKTFFLADRGCFFGLFRQNEDGKYITEIDLDPKKKHIDVQKLSRVHIEWNLPAGKKKAFDMLTADIDKKLQSGVLFRATGRWTAKPKPDGFPTGKLRVDSISLTTYGRRIVPVIFPGRPGNFGSLPKTPAEAFKGFRSQIGPIMKKFAKGDALKYWVAQLEMEKNWFVRRQSFSEALKRINNTLTEQEKKSLILHGNLKDLQRKGDCRMIYNHHGLGNGLAGYVDIETGRLIFVWIIPEG